MKTILKTILILAFIPPALVGAAEEYQPIEHEDAIYVLRLHDTNRTVERFRQSPYSHLTKLPAFAEVEPFIEQAFAQIGGGDSDWIVKVASNIKKANLSWSFSLDWGPELDTLIDIVSEDPQRLLDLVVERVGNVALDEVAAPDGFDHAHLLAETKLFMTAPERFFCHIAAKKINPDDKESFIPKRQAPSIITDASADLTLYWNLGKLVKTFTTIVPQDPFAQRLVDFWEGFSLQTYFRLTDFGIHEQFKFLLNSTQKDILGRLELKPANKSLLDSLPAECLWACTTPIHAKNTDLLLTELNPIIAAEINTGINTHLESLGLPRWQDLLRGLDGDCLLYMTEPVGNGIPSVTLSLPLEQQIGNHLQTFIATLPSIMQATNSGRNPESVRWTHSLPSRLCRQRIYYKHPPWWTRCA